MSFKPAVQGLRRRSLGVVAAFTCLLSCLAPGPVVKTGVSAVSDNAVLEGFATQIDDEYTRGDNGPYELVPGCHIVTTTAEPPRVQSSRNSYSRPVPKVYFVITAKARYKYVIVRQSEIVDGRYRRVVVSLETTAPDGTKEVRRGAPDTGPHPTSCVGATD